VKAVGYIRVSGAAQVEGYSLDAQERAIRQHCQKQGWQLLSFYRDEGRSAHTDVIAKRPEFKRLLDDVPLKKFDVVVVHTFDRWARHMSVVTNTLPMLARNGVGFASVTESIDYTTPEGQLFSNMLGSFNQFFSGALSKHTKKGIAERARNGLQLGCIPFGYVRCVPSKVDERKPCEPLHPGGVHQVTGEADAIEHIFREYSTGTHTMAKLAGWLNDDGFRTRNTKSLPDGRGGRAAGSKLFTRASVRGILHNPFYKGHIRHGKDTYPGLHQSIVSEALFGRVQAAIDKNRGRRSSPGPGVPRHYLLRGLIHCWHCGAPLWCQTLNSGNRYYREQARSRSHTNCLADGSSIRCELPDTQVEELVGSLTLPDSWLVLVLGQIHLADEAERVGRERDKILIKLGRLKEQYLELDIESGPYRLRKRLFEGELNALVVPEADASAEAGKLLEDLPRLWREADLSEKRKLLMSLLDAVYVDTIKKTGVVKIQPKAAFRPLFDIALGDAAGRKVAQWPRVAFEPVAVADITNLP
jgi:site-specific DNA recombinase